MGSPALSALPSDSGVRVYYRIRVQPLGSACVCRTAFGSHADGIEAIRGCGGSTTSCPGNQSEGRCGCGCSTLGGIDAGMHYLRVCAPYRASMPDHRALVWMMPLPVCMIRICDRGRCVRRTAHMIQTTNLRSPALYHSKVVVCMRIWFTPESSYFLAYYAGDCAAPHSSLVDRFRRPMFLTERDTFREESAGPLRHDAKNIKIRPPVRSPSSDEEVESDVSPTPFSDSDDGLNSSIGARNHPPPGILGCARLKPCIGLPSLTAWWFSSTS
ncbi:hypothetical protein B0H13DRAFT_2686561 [Mycena leptocephala]|nr:hypothetical protein B0H13DRAFT_2686561 [Mycena leptocephala]